ncbi:MAG: ABC transporter ATP-binding protein [Actinomycetota bacterium]
MTLLAVQNVSKSFAGLKALQNVSLRVERGSIVGLIGPNGAGKTTLFNVIAGVMKPDAGRVVFDGTDVTGWPAYRIARLGIGRTFQLMKPFDSLSVLDNVTVATLQRHRNRKEAREVAMEVVERLGLGQWANKRASVLSTAGYKRLELAKALGLEPSLLLLDEVLAGLVPSERTRVVELLREIRGEGVTMLLVEHVMSAVMALSDHIHVLHHGEMLASGTPEEVTKDSRVIEAYLGEEEHHAGA